VLRRVAQEIRSRVGPSATVSEQTNGTIIVMLPGDRTEAENTAASVVRELARIPIGNAGRDGQPVQVACAVVTFPKTGTPLARSVSGLAS
jgi:hypothetical protein